MKMELINKVNNTNTKSKTYALGLAFGVVKYASETELLVLENNNNSKLNVFSIFEKIKPTLKFIDQSKHFELYCSVLPKKTNPL